MNYSRANVPLHSKYEIFIDFVGSVTQCYRILSYSYLKLFYKLLWIDLNTMTAAGIANM